MKLLGSVVTAINLGCDLQRFLRKLVEHHMHWRAAIDGLASGHEISEFLYCHKLQFCNEVYNLLLGVVGLLFFVLGGDDAAILYAPVVADVMILGSSTVVDAW